MNDCKFKTMYSDLYSAIEVEIYNAMTAVIDNIYKVHPEAFDDATSAAIDKARERRPVILCFICRTWKLNNNACYEATQRYSDMTKE